MGEIGTTAPQPLAAFAEVRRLFDTWEGWTTHSESYDPGQLLEAIAQAVGAPLNGKPGIAPAPPEPDPLAVWLVRCLLNESQLAVVPPGRTKALRHIMEDRPATKADELRALIARGLTRGEIRNILAEADQDAYAGHIAQARKAYASDEIEIDDAPECSPGGDPGMWVAAWLWVRDEDVDGLKPGDDEDGEGEV